MSKPIMYLFLNRNLAMSVGKASSQVAHAAVQAYQLSKPEMIKKWMLGKHYTKIVLLARDEQHLQNIQNYLEARGFKTEMIIDEGLTEVDSILKTALGVEIVDKEDEHTEATFSSFDLYRETIRVKLEIER